MSRYQMVYGVMVASPQLRDLVSVETADRFCREQGHRTLPPLSECKTAAQFAERLGLGQMADLDAALGNKFIESLPLGWQYAPEMAELKGWDKEREQAQQWRTLHVPPLKADMAERKTVVDTAVEIARQAYQDMVAQIVTEMPAGADPHKWSRFAAERVYPPLQMLMTMREVQRVQRALDSEPDNTERDAALRSIQTAKDHLAIVDLKIATFWTDRWLHFENRLRENWGLSPVKRNAKHYERKNQLQEVMP